MDETRDINNFEDSRLNLIEKRLNDYVSSWELIESENIYDEDEDTVYRSFTFNRGMENTTFVISPTKEIKFFEYGVNDQLVDEVLISLD